MLPSTPMRRLLAASALCALLSLLGLAAALSVPSLGLRFDVPTGNSKLVQAVDIDPAGPARDVMDSSTVRALRSSDGARIELEAVDLIEESDFLSSYAEIERFFARQGELAQLLAQPALTLELELPSGERVAREITPRPRRVRDLPAAFWLQLAIGTAAFLVSAWVWALRHTEAAARWLALVGGSIFVFAGAAAIYSTRELALPSLAHRVLSALNHAGALTFGAAMIALFLTYPRPLVRARWLAGLFALVALWVVADIARLVPDPATGNQLPTLLEMLAILAAIAAQAFATRRDPRGRAALRWLGLSVVLGAGGFVALVIAPVLIGGIPPISQGAAFVLFLLIHVGVALGVARYRLFELDEWAFRLLFYLGALLALLGLDALLVLAFQLDPGPSLGLAVLALGLAWMPLRDWLWNRFVARRRPDENELFRSVVEVAFAAGAAERESRWTALLRRLFDPLELASAPSEVSEPALLDDGLVLALPARAGAPALHVRNPWGGRGLFGPSQLALARQLCALAAWIEESRHAYDRGAAEERRRISADLHDDVGARLLSGLHRDSLEGTRESVREALADVRTIASGLVGEKRVLESVVAALRHESGQRLDGAGLEFHWQSSGIDARQLPYSIYRNFVASHRELLSNAIRHSGARNVSVRLAIESSTLVLEVRDDGRGIDPTRPRGNGLSNLERRAATMGGTMRFESAEGGGLRATLRVPLEAAA
jgi:signal transduction histidine kinase